MSCSTRHLYVKPFNAQVSVTIYRIIEWPSLFSKFLAVVKSVVNIAPAFVALECSLEDRPGLPKTVQNTLIEVSIPFIIWACAVPVWVLIWSQQRLFTSARTHTLIRCDFVGVSPPRAPPRDDLISPISKGMR